MNNQMTQSKTTLEEEKNEIEKANSKKKGILGSHVEVNTLP